MHLLYVFSLLKDDIHVSVLTYVYVKPPITLVQSLCRCCFRDKSHSTIQVCVEYVCHTLSCMYLLNITKKISWAGDLSGTE